MWYPAKVTTAATAEPVTIDEVKRQCRVDFDDDDDLLSRLIKVARDHVERYCGTRLATQTVEIKCDGFADFCHLPEAPVQSISSVVYVDTNGEDQTLDQSVYELRNDGLDVSIATAYGKQWPAIQPRSRIIVTAVVGYPAVPEAVRHAMLMLLAGWYGNREQVLVGVSAQDLPMSSGVDALLCNFRRGV